VGSKRLKVRGEEGRYREENDQNADHPSLVPQGKRGFGETVGISFFLPGI